MGCPFAHSHAELTERPDLGKTEVCYQWANEGKCKKGEGCTFAHGVHELRSSKKGLPGAFRDAPGDFPVVAPMECRVDSVDPVQRTMLTDLLSQVEMIEARCNLIKQMMPIIGAPPGLPSPGHCGSFGYQNDHGQLIFAASRGLQNSRSASVSPEAAHGVQTSIWL